MTTFAFIIIAAAITFIAVDIDDLPIIWADDPIEGDVEISLEGVEE